MTRHEPRVRLQLIDLVVTPLASWTVLVGLLITPATILRRHQREHGSLLAGDGWQRGPGEGLGQGRSRTVPHAWSVSSRRINPERGGPRGRIERARQDQVASRMTWSAALVVLSPQYPSGWGTPPCWWSPTGSWPNATPPSPPTPQLRRRVIVLDHGGGRRAVRVLDPPTEARGHPQQGLEDVQLDHASGRCGRRTGSSLFPVLTFSAATDTSSAGPPSVSWSSCAVTADGGSPPAVGAWAAVGIGPVRVGASQPVTEPVTPPARRELQSERPDTAWHGPMTRPLTTITNAFASSSRPSVSAQPAGFLASSNRSSCSACCMMAYRPAT
jgi:hypothetical protein